MLGGGFSNVMETTLEIWKIIPGYDGNYHVSSFGRVKSISRYKINGWGGLTLLPEIIMSAKSTPQGYMQVGLRNPKQKLFYVHRLVAIAFLEKSEDKPEVNHKDGNKSNNHVINLEWSTPAENIIHSVALGLKKSYEKKLTEVQAMEVFLSLDDEKLLVGKYGITIRSIRDIKKKKRWAFIHNENPL